MNQPDPAEIEARVETAKRYPYGSFAEFYATDVSTLLAALASEKQRADTAQETSRLTDQQLDYMRDRLAAAEAVVVEAAERLSEWHDQKGYPDDLVHAVAAILQALANYHTATTEPGAEP